MLDDLERLRTSEPLLQLLTHYCRLADPNRESWQDRLMSLEAVDARELTKLHGLLLAMEWIELKVGHFSPGSNHPVPACYRVTNAGLRAVRQVQVKESDEPESELTVDEIPAAPAPKAPRRRREKALVETDGVAA